MKQIYVTLRAQSINDSATSSPLGFAGLYDLNKDKFNAKNRKQDLWARYSLVNGSYVRTTTDWGPRSIQRGYPNRKDVHTLVESHLTPLILDNEPRNDFTIAKTVSRYSTNNKLWRILDARGFELEISTSDMEDILMNGSVTEGKIIGYYVWDFGKTGIGKLHLKKA